MKGEAETYAVNDVINNASSANEDVPMDKEDEDEEKNEEKIKEDEEVNFFFSNKAVPKNLSLLSKPKGYS